VAGDWIKFELATSDKPEVLAMAELLGTSSDDVVGKLLRVWGWFDQQTQNGNAVSVTGNTLKRFIDRLVASQGFAACMEKVGWLNDSGVPNFERHNGESAKKRALTNKRVKRMRNADVTPDALPEKRREEKKKNNSADALSVTSLVADGLTEQTASDFLQIRKRKRAPLTVTAWDGIKAEALKAGWPIEAAVRKSVARGWQSFEATWVESEKGSALPAYK
jgi:hypothetical protein